jgi:hypothetical protein
MMLLTLHADVSKVIIVLLKAALIVFPSMFARKTLLFVVQLSSITFVRQLDRALRCVVASKDTIGKITQITLLTTVFWTIPALGVMVAALGGRVPKPVLALAIALVLVVLSMRLVALRPSVSQTRAARR